MDSWSRIAQALPAVRAVCDGERAIYEQIRARPVTAESPFVLFAGGMSLKKTKRPSSSSLTSQKHRKRIRNVYHNDKEQCSAENCLKPYSEWTFFLLINGVLLTHYDYATFKNNPRNLLCFALETYPRKRK